MALLSLSWTSAYAQLPPDFPTSTVTTNSPSLVGNGYIFQGVNLAPPGLGYYAMILTNDGTPIWYQQLTNACYDFKVLPNGNLHYAEQIHALTYTGGGDVVHQILDEHYNPVETIQAGNGYIAEAHDFQMLPNGDALLLGYYLSQVDMSQVVPNGNPAALVSGAVLQELDGQRNVVWQWRFWDHYPFAQPWVNSTAPVISEFHVNCLFLDNDGNLIVSTPEWVKKINRQTGDIMWHLGGTQNQFTFIGVTQPQGLRDFASHDINRLPNGDVLLYSNSQFGQATSTSRVNEYSLDETNKTATLVWSYTPQPGISGPYQGSAQRLANGDTFIGWGGLPGQTKVACSEVCGTNVVFQMIFDNTNVVSYRSFRFPYPPESQAIVASVQELALGNSYVFTNTFVSLSVQSGGGGYNQLTVTREPYAPLYPVFQSKPPRVLPVRVSLTESAISPMAADIEFDAQSFGFAAPTNVTVYYRQTTGQGVFLPQPTSYNPSSRKLSASINLTPQGSDFGELVFGYPDLADIPYPPLLDQVENYRGVQPYDVIAPLLANPAVVDSVNQTLPILLSWSPKGFARSYQVQISMNADFSSTVLSVGYQTAAFYVWNGALPSTTYYYRVKTINAGGASEWAAGSFQTVSSFLSLSFPNGGEALQRGQQYFIRWNSNLGGTVKLDLYKSGAFYENLATNAPNSGAYQWQVGFDLIPGSDYSVQVSSSTNAALSALSAGNFSVIDPPTITTGSMLLLPDGRVQFSVTALGASQVSVLGSTDLSSWQLVRTLSLSNGTGLFTGASLTNSSAIFYRLRVP